VKTKAACEKAVAVRNMNKVIFICTNCTKLTCSDIVPYIKVVSCVAYYNLFACSTTGCVKSYNILCGYRKRP